MSDDYIVKNTSFIVLSSDALTVLSKKTLDSLYLPIVGKDAIGLYYTLYNFVNQATLESVFVEHSFLLKQLSLTKESDFKRIRCYLEALDLLNVYYNDGVYVYYLKRVKSPREFFQNSDLLNLLYMKMGSTKILELAYLFSVSQVDLKKYKNITKKLSDVFVIDNEAELTENLDPMFNDEISNIRIDNNKFDYALFEILISTSDLLPIDTLKNKQFYELIIKTSYLFSLNEEDLKNIVMGTVNSKKEFDAVIFNQITKKYYTSKNKLETPVLKPRETPIKDDDKLAKILSNYSTNEISKKIFGDTLTAAEIEMFNQLSNDLGLSIAVINGLFIHITRTKNGEIPSYEYFLKVGKDWKRQKLDNPTDVSLYLSSGELPLKKENKEYKTSKPTKKIVKNVPEWFDEYIEEMESSKPKVKKSKQITLEEAFKMENGD